MRGTPRKHFPQAVEAWHGLGLTISTAVAALMGLLFVSLSLNVEVIPRAADVDLHVMAAHTPTFGHFVSVLVSAVLFLIPRQVPSYGMIC